MTHAQAIYYGRYLTAEEEAAYAAENNEVITPLKYEYRRAEKEHRAELQALFEATDAPRSIRVMLLTGYINYTDMDADTRAAVIAYHIHTADADFWTAHPTHSAAERHAVEDAWAAGIGWDYPVLKLIATTELYWRLVAVIDRIADAYDDLPESRDEFMQQIKRTKTKQLITDNYKLSAIGIIHRATADDYHPDDYGREPEDTLLYLEDLADIEGTPYSDRPYVWDRNLAETIAGGFASFCGDTRRLERIASRKMERAAELRSKAQGVSAIRYDSDRVQTSPDPDRLADIMSDITELEQSSRNMSREYITRAQEFSQLCNIAGLDAQETYAATLYYTKGMGYADIAREIGITEDRARYICTGYSKQVNTHERLLRAIAIEYIKAHTDWTPESHPEPIYNSLPDLYWAA